MIPSVIVEQFITVARRATPIKKPLLKKIVDPLAWKDDEFAHKRHELRV